ncbi:MAG: hypothetical protein RIR17_2392 [Planctomycetota bacterium]|jgi:hypothetical protein|nr:hypothetical protein [bacterium]
MRNLLAFAAFCVLAFVTIGYFQGWYMVKANISTDGNRNVNIDFNTKKITADIGKGTEFVQEKIKTLEENEKKNVSAHEETGSKAQR